MQKIKILLLTFATSYSLYGEEVFLEKPTPEVWMTGSLIAPAGQVVPLGDFSIQSYFFYAKDRGEYDSHWKSHATPGVASAGSQLAIWVGLTSWIDFQAHPTFVTNFSQGESSSGFADLPLGFDFQLLNPETTWFPGIKLSILEFFPTGRYNNFSPTKAEVSSIGDGLYSTEISLVFYKLFHLKSIYYLSSNFSIHYAFAPPTHIKGFNTYGGGFETEGTIRAGNTLQVIYAFEIKLSKNWTFALDNVYIHTDRNHFWGNRGFDFNRLPAEIDLTSSEQISFCPSIEYNFSETLGLIGGAWITAFGRNCSQFVNAIVSLAYTY